MNTGNKPSPAVRYPSLGSLTSRLLTTPDEVPPYVSFGNDRNGGTNAGYLGPAWNPFQVQNGNGRLEVRGVTLPEDVTLDDLSGRVRLIDTFDYRMSVLDGVADVVSGIDQFQEKALNILRSSKTREAFFLDGESAETRERYGNDGDVSRQAAGGGQLRAQCMGSLRPAWKCLGVVVSCRTPASLSLVSPWLVLVLAGGSATHGRPIVADGLVTPTIRRLTNSFARVHRSS